MSSTKWFEASDVPNWVRDRSGRVVGYKDENGNFFGIPSSQLESPSDNYLPLEAVQPKISAGMEPWGFPLTSAPMTLVGNSTPSRAAVQTVDGEAVRITGTSAGTISITMALPKPIRVIDAALWFQSAATQDSVGVYFATDEFFTTNISRGVYVGNEAGASSCNGAVLSACSIGHGDFAWDVQGTVNANTLMSHMRIFVTPKSGQLAEITLSRIAINQGGRGRICITVDDGWDSWYRYAIPELNRRQMPCTAAIIASAVGSPGFFTLQELRQMKDAGHELIAHGVNDVLGGNLYGNGNLNTDAKRLADTKRSIDFLRDNGLFSSNAQEQCFVWPGGIFQGSRGDVGVLDLFHDAGIKYARTTTAALPVSVAAMGRGKYSNMILPIIGHGRGTTRVEEDASVAKCIAQIQRCADYGLDGILMFHKVIADQSTFATVADNGIAIEIGQLNLILDAIDAQRSAGKITVTRFSELFV